MRSPVLPRHLIGEYSHRHADSLELKIFRCECYKHIASSETENLKTAILKPSCNAGEPNES